MSNSDFLRTLGLDSGVFCVEAVGDSFPSSSCGEEEISSDFRIRSSSASTAFGANPSASLLMNANHTTSYIEDCHAWKK